MSRNMPDSSHNKSLKRMPESKGRCAASRGGRFIERTPGRRRSFRLLVSREQLARIDVSAVGFSS